MKYALALGLTGLVAVNAHPHAVENKDGADLSKRAVDVSAYTIPGLGSYTSAAKVGEASFSIASNEDYVEAATQLVKEIAPDAEFRVVEDHYVGTNGIAHVNFKQTVHGLDVDNGDFSVNVRKDGSILSHGNSFFTGKLPEEAPHTKRDYADPVAALKDVISVLDLPVEAGDDTAAEASFSGDDDTLTLTGTTGAVSDPKARLVYLYDGEDLKLTWRVETDIEDNWLLTYVDASSTTEVVGVVDYVSDLATYEVYPWGVNDPTDGSRTIKTDPWLLSASPFTWIGDGTTNYTTTRGNNAIAQVNPTGGTAYLNNFRPVSPENKFEYPYSVTDTDVQSYWNASITQLFYTANQLHDLLYVLGFDESAGNFQTNNNGKGGAGNDFVILNAQDGSGTNNANFATPPDGQNGRMRMYLWTYSTPRRDCSFEAGVVIHEYVHGLSNRLTGGPSNSGCLPSGEPGGMGEGWSDFFATAIRLNPDDTRATDYPMGAWVRNSAAGIRAYPYSTSLTTNPLTYRNVGTVSGVHAIGTIWATILYEVLWNLIDTYGKNDADFPTFDSNGVPTDGKFLALKLVQDGLALQPCRPTFVAARDAIIDADEALTEGQNYCRLWRAFAKRGLGIDAVASPRAEDFTLPERCRT